MQQITSVQLCWSFHQRRNSTNTWPCPEQWELRAGGQESPSRKKDMTRGSLRRADSPWQCRWIRFCSVYSSVHLMGETGKSCPYFISDEWDWMVLSQADYDWMDVPGPEFPFALWEEWIRWKVHLWINQRLRSYSLWPVTIRPLS